MCDYNNSGSNGNSSSGFICVSAVKIENNNLVMDIGESRYMRAVAYPENATQRRLVWSSSNPSVVSVNYESGLMTAYNAGQATIYASATDGSGRYADCCVYVRGTVMVKSIEVSPQRETLHVGDQSRLTASVCPTNAADTGITWSSSKPEIVEVHPKSGKIRAHAAGKATVTATAIDGSGVSGSAEVKVLQTIITPSEVEPSTDNEQSKTDNGLVGDPVDAYSGGHLLKNTLMSLFGGQGTALVAHYNSTQLVKGSLGIGWYHNFEKKLELCGNEAWVYNTPSSYMKFTTTDYMTYNCTSKGKSGYILWVDTLSSAEYPYILDRKSVV